MGTPALDTPTAAGYGSAGMLAASRIATNASGPCTQRRDNEKVPLERDLFRSGDRI
jgi:hypothetical protein